jgi:hypothetical protein
MVLTFLELMKVFNQTIQKERVNLTIHPYKILIGLN